MAQEDQLVERYRQLPERERKSLIDYADTLLGRQRTGPGSDNRPSASQIRRERSDLGRYLWEQAGF